MLISSRRRRSTLIVLSLVVLMLLFLSQTLISKSVGASPPITQQVCPYSVRAGAWTATNLRMQPGQKVVISATGTLRYKDGARIEFGPGGDMYGIWSLKAKVGSQIENIGGKGTFIATQEGQLELGAPAKANLPVEDGLTYLDSNYQYCVTVTPADEGQLRVSVVKAPKEVWVGWGRENMAVSLCITGFISNSPEPLRVDCPKMENSFGDHKDPSGDRLKTVRIDHCGETAAPYNWAGHTCTLDTPGYYPTRGYLWGMFISAPARDLENDKQPGRPKDICIGTNPVTLKFSQKGAGEALVTLSPELVLKAGLVGGGGSYDMTSNCSDGGGAGGTLRCGLGKVWRESESGWTGTWRRRGDSNVFDAHWDKPGWQSIDQIVTVSVSGSSISIYRQDPNIANNTCSYSGVIGSDGSSVSGDYICNNRGVVIGPAKWNATIDCNPVDDNKCTAAGSWSQSAEGIGASTWVVTDNGQATEIGLGGARGTATFSGTTMRIDWTIGAGLAGTYEWNLDSKCKSGSGRLTFTRGRSDVRTSTVTHQ